mgnify:FL=1
MLIRMVILLLLANGAPVLAAYVFGDRLSMPIDGGRSLPDGRPVFGASKTWRGMFCSVLLSALGGAWLLHSMTLGMLIGLGAMAGDLLSSFIKRRLGKPSGSKLIGLDQVPESLFPGLLVASELGLSPHILLWSVIWFSGLQLLLSWFGRRLFAGI